MEPMGKAALAITRSGGRGLKSCDVPFAANHACDFQSNVSVGAMYYTVARKKPGQDGRAMCVILSSAGSRT
jgi:hypothetical protein